VERMLRDARLGLIWTETSEHRALDHPAPGSTASWVRRHWGGACRQMRRGAGERRRIGPSRGGVISSLSGNLKGLRRDCS